MAEARRIQRQLSRVFEEAQQGAQEATKGGSGAGFEHVRQAVLRFEAAVAELSAAVAGLTQREVEVYRLEREGYSAEGISQQLMIQPGTTRTHLKRLHGKLVAAELRVPNTRSSRDSRGNRDGGDDAAEGR